MVDSEGFRAVLARMKQEGWHERPTGKAAERLHQSVKDAADDGAVWAKSLLWQGEHDFLRRQWVAELKRTRHEVLVSWSGEILNVPKMFGRRIRRPDGTRTREYQLAMIKSMSWDQLEAVIAEYQNQQNRLGSSLLLMKGILKLREEHPSALSPSDACALAGIDLDAAVIAGLV